VLVIFLTPLGVIQVASLRQAQDRSQAFQAEAEEQKTAMKNHGGSVKSA